MGHDEARVPLTELAARYEAIKREVASGLRARQLASRFGGTPAGDGDAPPPGKQDARKIAAERLDAGVSHTTLEKVLWLRRVGFDMERRASLRREAMDGLEAVDGGAPVNWPYDKVHTLVLIDDLEQAAAGAPTNSVVKIVAERHLRLLRERGVYAATPAMKRQARKALADAQRLDRDIEDAVSRDPAAWLQLKAAFKRRRKEDRAAYAQAEHEKYLAWAGLPPDGGANP